MPRSGWLLHHDVVSLLQVSDKMIGHELRHEVVAVTELAATVALKSKGQRKPKLVGISRAQLCGVIGHTDRLDQP
jgi:hypothetical protein